MSLLQIREQRHNAMQLHTDLLTVITAVFLDIVVKLEARVFQQRSRRIHLVLSHQNVHIAGHTQFRMRIAARHACPLQHSRGDAVRMKELQHLFLGVQHGLRADRRLNRRAAHPAHDLLRHILQLSDSGIQQRGNRVGIRFVQHLFPIDLRGIVRQLLPEQLMP